MKNDWEENYDKPIVPGSPVDPRPIVKRYNKRLRARDEAHASAKRRPPPDEEQDILTKDGKRFRVVKP